MIDKTTLNFQILSYSLLHHFKATVERLLASRIPGTQSFVASASETDNRKLQLYRLVSLMSIVQMYSNYQRTFRQVYVSNAYTYIS